MSALDWTRGGDALLGQRCPNGHRWYLPRVRCPECGAAVESFQVDGAGTLFAVTTVHRRTDGDAGPIGLALVDFDEGIRALVRCAPGTPIGARVRVSIITDPGSDSPMPYAEASAT